MPVWISMFLRSVKPRSKVCVPFSEGATSCLQITPQLITLLQLPQLSSASKRWSVQEVRRCLVTYPALSAVRQNQSLFLTASLRQQRGHHHTSRAGPPEGADGHLSPGSCQTVLRDSAASDDTQPRGENTNIHKWSQILPSLFISLFRWIGLLCLLCLAGDSQRHAGLSQAVQRQAQLVDPLGRTQRSDHHGETRRGPNAENHQSGKLTTDCRLGALRLPAQWERPAASAGVAGRHGESARSPGQVTPASALTCAPGLCVTDEWRVCVAV